MIFHDISLTIQNGMVVWPGDPPVRLERVSQIENGDAANVSKLEMSVHTGTHLDAPYHFVHGARTIEALPLDVLIGPVQVVEMEDSVGLITAREIQTAGIAPGVIRVLIKTRNSALWLKKQQVFDTTFAALSEDGAEALVQLGIRLVGIDYLSIAPYHQSTSTHVTLLKNEVVILEGLDLGSVAPGAYVLICLPPKLGGSDGAPARAVLVEGM